MFVMYYRKRYECTLVLYHCGLNPFSVRTVHSPERSLLINIFSFLPFHNSLFLLGILSKSLDSHEIKVFFSVKRIGSCFTSKLANALRCICLSNSPRTLNECRRILDRQQYERTGNLNSG